MRTGILALATLIGSGSAAAVEPHRSFYTLPSSNGWGAVVVDLQQGKAHHWRDHLFATEEPQWDAHGHEVWVDDHPQAVYTRDLLFDAYFGLRADGNQQWLVDLPVDLDRSGYVGAREDGSSGGTQLLELHRSLGDLSLRTVLWSPWNMERSAMAMVLEVENTGGSMVSGLSAFSLHNLHLGEGRPGPTEETGTQNETLVLAGERIEERGFAGVVSLVPLRAPSHTSGWYPGAPWDNPFEVVQAGGSTDLPARSGDLGVHDDSVSYLQWDAGDLAPGETTRFGVVLAHHGDPFAIESLSTEVQAWVDGRDVEQILADERSDWQRFQDGLLLPTELSEEEELLYRHSAVVLRMAQVREDRAYLREWLSRDGEPRYSLFGSLPGEVVHKAKGGVLASLPPGRWTYAWPRDGAYAILGMSLVGMHDEAREALRYLLDAESNRYVGYDELSHYPMADYQISLCRHHGFGIEESDTLGGGDFNFEFDGAGLFLWSLGEYVRATGDWSLVEERWPTIRDRVADFLLPLIDSDGLILPDSSIWEHHWYGAERKWSFTSLTAARGLCDAADMAEHVGDAALATSYREAAEQIRRGILSHLRDESGAVAQTLEELEVGTGYADVSSIEAVSMGLYDPDGETSASTRALITTELQTPAGPGFSRNDDAWDAHDLSWWGSSYDSDEWVWADLRMELAARLSGDTALADELLSWITGQSTANYLAIGETFDPYSGDYTNNAPMVGYGAGAYITALHHRAGSYTIEPACGRYGEDVDEPSDSDTTDSGEPGDTDTEPVDTAPPEGETAPPEETDSPADDPPTGDTGSVDSAGQKPAACGCTASPGSTAPLWGLLGLLGLRRRGASADSQRRSERIQHL